jgi:hypothetical protein
VAMQLYRKLHLIRQHLHSLIYGRDDVPLSARSRL